MYCSYCNNYGHTKRKCKTLREDAEKGHWRASRYIQEWKEAAERRKRNIEEGNFWCSYCGGRGHRRNACEDLKSHREQFVEILNTYRAERKPILSSYGLGKGSILSLKLKRWDDIVYDERKVLSLGWDESSIHPFSKEALLDIYDSRTGRKAKLKIPNQYEAKNLSENPLDLGKLGHTETFVRLEKTSPTTFSESFTKQATKSALVKKLFSTKPGEYSFPRDWGRSEVSFGIGKVTSFFNWDKIRQEENNVL